MFSYGVLLPGVAYAFTGMAAHQFGEWLRPRLARALGAQALQYGRSDELLFCFDVARGASMLGVAAVLVPRALVAGLALFAAQLPFDASPLWLAGLSAGALAAEGAHLTRHRPHAARVHLALVVALLAAAAAGVARRNWDPGFVLAHLEGLALAAGSRRLRGAAVGLAAALAYASAFGRAPMDAGFALELVAAWATIVSAYDFCCFFVQGKEVDGMRLVAYCISLALLGLYPNNAALALAGVVAAAEFARGLEYAVFAGEHYFVAEKACKRFADFVAYAGLAHEGAEALEVAEHCALVAVFACVVWTGQDDPLFLVLAFALYLRARLPQEDQGRGAAPPRVLRDGLALAKPIAKPIGVLQDAMPILAPTLPPPPPLAHLTDTTPPATLLLGEGVSAPKEEARTDEDEQRS